MLPNNILPDEELTDLCINQWKVLQKKQGFRFSCDAVLLSHFAQPKTGQRVLDLGTGSGVIATLLAAYHPDIQIDGVELQSELVDMAQRSVQYNRLTARITITQQDLTCLPDTYRRQYDWVVSNPPFFPLGQSKESPNRQVAIARHEVACTLEQVLQSSTFCLKDRGHLALVHRAERLAEILQLCRQNRLAPYRLRLVHPANDQPANLLLLEAIRDGRNGLTVLPPLILLQPDGSYSDEMHTYIHEQQNKESL